MGLALNHLQRQAIQNDPDWDGWLLSAAAAAAAWVCRWLARLACSATSRRPCSKSGLRAIRTGMAKTHGVTTIGAAASSAADSTLPATSIYQGERFIERFDANAYLAILRTMETWDPLHGQPPRRRHSAAFGRVSALSVSVLTGCFRRIPCGALQTLLRSAGVTADYREMTSSHGHDAFLAEQAELVRLLQ